MFLTTTNMLTISTFPFSVVSINWHLRTITPLCANTGFYDLPFSRLYGFENLAFTWFSALIMIASHTNKEGELLDTLQPGAYLSYKRFNRITSCLVQDESHVKQMK